jgi:hypothetical protein
MKEFDFVKYVLITDSLKGVSIERKKEFESISNAFFRFLKTADIRVGDQLLFETSEGELWYRVEGRIIVPRIIHKPMIIIQLKEI